MLNLLIFACEFDTAKNRNANWHLLRQVRRSGCDETETQDIVHWSLWSQNVCGQIYWGIYVIHLQQG